MGLAIETAHDRVEWRSSASAVRYPTAIAEMESRVAAIRAGTAPELVWLLEHPPLYTAGTSARDEDLLDPNRLPVHRAGRGGRYTYHGPGQRIAYVMLDLARRGEDVHCYVHHLEEWGIRTLARFGVIGERRDGRIGIWVPHAGGEAKIAAIGVRVRRWVTYHGIAINIDPDLDHYRGIIPCGIDPKISGHGVTSLAALGIVATTADVDAALRATFAEVFQEALACRPHPNPPPRAAEGREGATGQVRR
jgi:lipoyl(octanoyl) transferase